MDTKKCRAQALVELAFGMFALALVLSALFAFATYVVKSLDVQREVRAEAGRSALSSSANGATSVKNDEATFDSLATDYVFGSESVKIKEKVYLPPLKIDNNQ